MRIINKAAALMFTGRGAKALTEISLGARCLKDFKIGPGAKLLIEQSGHVNTNFTMIGQGARETLCMLDRLGAGLSMKTEQRI